MGGLAHYLEHAGIPTTSISLIREHSERMRPPRTLWVPFELGRPLGVPNDAAFQRAVVLAALQLLEVEDGPVVLQDYAVEAPAVITSADGWACPLNLPPVEAAGEIGPLTTAFQQEMQQMRSWYDLAVSRRGSTTVGASGLHIEALADFICTLLAGRIPQVPTAEIPLVRRVNLVADDIRALYAEALTAQPGQDVVGADQLADWFYTETAAGRVFHALRAAGSNREDAELQAITGSLAVPARLASGA